MVRAAGKHAPERRRRASGPAAAGLDAVIVAVPHTGHASSEEVELARARDVAPVFVSSASASPPSSAMNFL